MGVGNMQISNSPFTNFLGDRFPPAFGDGGGIGGRNIDLLRVHQCFEAEDGAQN